MCKAIPPITSAAATPGLGDGMCKAPGLDSGMCKAKRFLPLPLQQLRALRGAVVLIKPPVLGEAPSHASVSGCTEPRVSPRHADGFMMTHGGLPSARGPNRNSRRLLSSLFSQSLHSDVSRGLGSLCWN